MRTAGTDEPARPDADSVATAVRVHADRVHDFVRRQGCPPAASVGVVEASALDLVALAVREPAAPAVLVGRWFAAAGRLAERQKSGAEAGPPVGSGLLAADDEQEVLATGLGDLPADARWALLLRDAYDLPAETVGAGLGLDPAAALRRVGTARLELLPRVFDDDPPPRPTHAVDEAVLTRLAEGRGSTAADAGTTRHLRACEICSAVVHAQDDVRRLLVGLSVAALPDDAREPLLERVAGRARALLPGPLPEPEPEPAEEPRPLLSPLAALLGLLLAVLAGVGLGALLSRTPSVQADTGAAQPLVTAPVATPLPGDDPSPLVPPLPTTRVFTFPPTAPPAPPRTTPPPSSASPTPPPTPAPAVELQPASGPTAARVTVTGSGWTPGGTVTLSVLDPAGRALGRTATATVDAAGAFSGTVVVGVAESPPGRYQVQAADGSRSVRSTYTIS